MKNKKYIRLIFFGLLSLVFTMSNTLHAQNNLTCPNNLADSEKVEIKYKWPEFFGKLKLKVGDYAEGHNKIGISSTTSTNYASYNKSEKNQPFSVYLKDNNQLSAKLKGKIIILENLVIHRNSNFVREITGIETEEVQQQLDYLKTIDAAITMDKNPKTWQLHFENKDRFIINLDTLCYLKGNSRKIDIITPYANDENTLDETQNCQTIVFTENGNCLAQVCGLNIQYNPKLEDETRLIITAAILALDN